MARKKGNSSGFGWGLLLGLVIAVVGVAAYFKWGQKPGQTGVPVEGKPVASVPAPVPAAPVRQVHAVKQPPFGISEDAFEAGAHIYSVRCSGCHGRPGHDAGAVAGAKRPALQLWKRRGDVVGASAQQPGVIYEKTAYGELQNGMPAFEHQLSETQIWQVSLLLKNANQELPDPVMGILKK